MNRLIKAICMLLLISALVVSMSPGVYAATTTPQMKRLPIVPSFNLVFLSAPSSIAFFNPWHIVESIVSDVSEAVTAPVRYAYRTTIEDATDNLLRFLRCGVNFNQTVIRMFLMIGKMFR